MLGLVWLKRSEKMAQIERGSTGAREAVRPRRDASPTRSVQSIDRVNPEAPGWTKRLCLGSEPPDRAPCPFRMSALEQSIHKYAEEPDKSLVRPELGLSFDSLGEAYDFIICTPSVN
ncbi:hypothetical protein VPH35_082792 [Triticum aestivum]